MRNRFILLLIIALLIPLNYIQASSLPLSEVDDIHKIIEEENLSLQEWELLIKEQVGSEQFSEVKKNIEVMFEKPLKKVKETDMMIKLQASIYANDVTESITIIIPKQDKQQFNIMYTIVGTKWNEQIEDTYNQKINSLLQRVFTENLTKFSCFTSQPDGMMNSGYLFKKLVDELNINTLSNIKENDFSVLSGYTPRWNSVIPISDEPMNVQIASRKGLGGKTTITIGTPIITNEY
ncbi:YwmB family TATA-box binding protein [Radiobacillus sp. PE A8.2]|uniref:YwmB family TATA-box binding protein n=1 Tax=Radiobacillus sp. PE A8.2 TaxID=3380349 RepID=UPI00388E901F